MNVDSQAFIDSVAQSWPPRRWRDVNVLVAVSGGPDSVALLRAIHQIRLSQPAEGKLFVGHIDHQLRQGQSSQDTDWVAKLASSLGLEFCSSRLEPPSSSCGQGREGWMRRGRYTALKQIAHQRGARFIATGHTRDDQIETILFRILRGTGLDGLAGIPKFRSMDEATTIVRPVLNLPRDAVLDYLHEIGQEFRTDDSNQDLSFRRNLIRHHLLPELRSGFGASVDGALIRLSDIARDNQRLLDRLAEGVLNHFDIQSAAITINDVEKLGSYQPELVLHALRCAWRQANWPLQAMNMEKWQNLLKGVLGTEKQPGNELLPNRVRVHRTANKVVMQRCGDLDPK